MLAVVLVLAAGFVPQDWYAFAPEGKDFRVEMPERPNSTSSRTVTSGANRSQLTAAKLTTDGAIYSFQVTENRGRVDPRTLDDGIRRWAADNRGTLGPVKPISVDGSPGREFTMTERSDRGDLRSKLRWVASGNRLFMLMAAGKPGGDVPADADRFLGSLKIGAAAKVAAKAAPAPPPAPAAPAAPAAGAADDLVSSAKPAFTIKLPGKAQTKKQSTPGPKGVIQQTVYYCKIDGELYTAQVLAEPEPVPAAGEKAALERGKADMIRSANATPTDQSRVETNGVAGVEFTTKAPAPPQAGKGMVESRTRIFVMDGLFVILTAMSAPDKPLSAAADPFFRSFRPGEQAPAAAGVAMEDEAKAKEPKAEEPKAKAAPKTSSKKAAASPKITTIRPPRTAKAYPAEDLEDLKQSFLGRDREGFRDVGPAGSVLVGVRVTYFELFGGMKVRSVQPIFRSGKNHYEGQMHGDPAGPVQTFAAKPGYAVGGLVTHTGLGVDGFRMVFMKVDGDRLDPEDSYNSPWIGDENGGGPGEVMTKGGLVVGLQGRAGDKINALGLTARK